jgi:DNA repair protein SbcD/Mre11
MRTVRLLHTSDVHLDTSFAGSGLPSRLGDRKRESLRASFRDVLQRGGEEAVDLVLVAGDLFELDRVTADTLEFLKRQFSALAPVPVFISPGNHDPCIQGSPYRDASWPPNVHIFCSEAWTSVELPKLGVRVTGFGYQGAGFADTPFARLPRLPDGAANIVLAHASDAGRVPPGKVKHAPFSASDLSGRNIQYCALGHYHQQREIPDVPDGTVAWYCGIPEERGWDEQGAAGFLLVDVDSGGTRVRRCESGLYPLRQIHVECDGFTTREQIVEALLSKRPSAFDERTILKVELTGYLDPRVSISIPELDERLSGAALHIRWVDSTRPALDFEALAAERTLRGRFVRKLNERVAAAPGGGERELLERARLYGVRALGGLEVSPR